MNQLTSKQIRDLNLMNQVTNDALLGTRLDKLAIKTGTPVNAVNATQTLTFTSVVTHGEKLTIQKLDEAGDTYEFTADADSTVSEEGNIAVDIEASTTKATVTLTVDTKATAGDTMTIGTKKYTFVAVAADDSDGEISVGADKAGTQANIVAAINGSDGHNVPHPHVTAAAFAADACVITAKIGGTIGNSIASTETFTANTNVFDTAALVGGTNCSAANAVTALVSAITASDTQGVGAADGAGDTVVLTADVAGVAGNFIYVVDETLINGSFPDDVTSLEGGVNGTVGLAFDQLVDTSYLYVAIADNTISGKNWRRISLGSVF